MPISLIETPSNNLCIFLSIAGQCFQLGGTAQASGTALLKKPGGASLPSRALGGAAPGPGLPRGSLKASYATEKDEDCFDTDDWFKDYEIDPEDVGDGTVSSLSAAATRDNNEDEDIDIMNSVAPPPPSAEQQPQPQLAPDVAKPAATADNKAVSEDVESFLSEEQQQSPGNKEMKCELSGDDGEKAREEKETAAATPSAKTTKDSKAAAATLEEEEKQLRSGDDLGSLCGKDDEEEDEVMIEVEKAPAALPPPAPSKAPTTKAAGDGSSPQKVSSSFQFPNLSQGSRLSNNNNKPRIPSRLGPGRSTPLTAAAAPITTTIASVDAPAATASKINESFSPLFPSAATTKSPALAPLVDGRSQRARPSAPPLAGTPTPITPAGERLDRGGAVITPGTDSSSFPVTGKKSAATPQTTAAATALPAASPAAHTAPPPPPPTAPAPPVDILNDALLKIDFSARGDEFLSSLEDEQAATQEALATPTAKKIFSLGSSVATAGVETESLSKRVEEVEVNLTMLRLRYAVDALEVAVKKPAAAAAAAAAVGLLFSLGGAKGGGEEAAAEDRVNEEAMEIDIMT